MMKVGIEEPARPSQYLLKYDVLSGKVVYEDYYTEEINRYVATASDIGELRQTVVPAFLNSVVTLKNWSIRYMVAFRPGISTIAITPARQRLIESRYCKNGWSMNDLEGKRVLMGPVRDTHEGLGFDAFISKQAFMLLIGQGGDGTIDDMPLDALATPLCEGWAASSDSGVRILSDIVQGLAYLQYDDTKRPGIILLTKAFIPSTVFQVLDVAEILADAKAFDVWRL